MSVRIRLQRHGRKQTPLYHIVVADARAPRDGRFIEKIGMYNPMTRPATIEIDRMKAYEWLKNGAQPTDTVHAILRFKGVMHYKHLQRGVAKGAMTPEDAEMKFREWVDAKEARIEERIKATAEERKQRAAQVSGSRKAAKKKQTEPEDELLNVDLAQAAASETAGQQEETEISADSASETATADAETPAETTPSEETPVQETTEEASTAEATAGENPAEETPAEQSGEKES